MDSSPPRLPTGERTASTITMSAMNRELSFLCFVFSGNCVTTCQNLLTLMMLCGL